jgi:hypothetical protein
MTIKPARNIRSSSSSQVARSSSSSAAGNTSFGLARSSATCCPAHRAADRQWISAETVTHSGSVADGADSAEPSDREGRRPALQERAVGRNPAADLIERLSRNVS